MSIVRPKPGPLSELCAELEPIVREARATDPLYSYQDAAVRVTGARIIFEWCRRHGIDPEKAAEVRALLACE